MERETIEFDVADNVATVTLNRPDHLNSFNEAMALDLKWAWETIRDTDDIHCAVLQGNGDRAFCTGMDVTEGGAGGSWFTFDNPWNSFDPGIAIAPKFRHRVWKPVITAVHGLCAGGAQYFLNESDIIICSDDAVFFDPHMNVGIVSALEPIGMLHRGVPLGDVLRWALMGTEERITAATALRIGLVTEVLARDALRARAREIALSIARRNPKAIQGTIRAIWESLDMNLSTALLSGVSYTLIGNFPVNRPAPRDKSETQYR
ncbi:MAG TPA: enoyl-CoA hydratase/isomerase family protein [Acidimicrobiales bacterium]|nr:enoyl-CoA hydratase/isomerase family protein [Acidimicrobiales bacterium]